MNCHQFTQLNPKERLQFAGELLHAVTTDPEFFEMANEIIDIARKRGAFIGVTIMPDALEFSRGEPYGDNRLFENKVAELKNNDV